MDRRDWTVDDVASLPEDLHYELINGRLALSPSPMPFHQFVGNEILYALRARRPREFFLSTDQSILVDSRNEPRPDVVVMRRTGANRTPVLAADVLLVVEVISPESTTRDRQDKTDGRVTIDQPWEVTLDLPEWTQERDDIREDARPNG